MNGVEMDGRCWQEWDSTDFIVVRRECYARHRNNATLPLQTYPFVNAMTTVAGVIFIYAPQTKVASIAVVAMDDTGDTRAACAMALMIVYTSVAVKLAQSLITKWIFRRHQAWRASPANL